MQSKPYSKKVNDWLMSTSGCGLGDFCRKFGYPRRETRIVEELDEEDEAKTKSIIRRDKELTALWRSSKDNESVNLRKGKNRSLTEFYKTLVTGWVVEDLVISMLTQKGIDVRHNGADTQRDIDKANSVSQAPDILVTVGDNSRTVELTCEFNDILSRDGYIEKRAPALYNLWQKKSLWLYFDLPSGKYILVDFATEPTSLTLRWHDYWQKDAHRYTLEENGKKIRDDRLLAAELISVVGCDIKGKEQPEINEEIDCVSPPREWGIGGVRIEYPKDSTPVDNTEPNQKGQSDIAKEKGTERKTTQVKSASVVNTEPSLIKEEPVLSDEELGIEDFV